MMQIIAEISQDFSSS